MSARFLVVEFLLVVWACGYAVTMNESRFTRLRGHLVVAVAVGGVALWMGDGVISVHLRLAASAVITLEVAAFGARCGLRERFLTTAEERDDE